MKYFVSGHRDLTKEEFEKYYIPLIQKVMLYDEDAEFIVGDWEGCDTMFIEYMLEYKFDVFINVYCVNSPQMIPLKDFVSTEFPNIFINLRNTHDKCDASMTKDSDFDIAWIRPGKENSHTAKNIKRRYNL